MPNSCHYAPISPAGRGPTFLAVLDLAHEAPPHARAGTQRLGVFHESLDFIDRSASAQKPFFAWFNTSRMHVWTHLKPEYQGKTGIGLYPDGMVEHDDHVGQLLDKLDELGLADDDQPCFRP